MCYINSYIHSYEHQNTAVLQELQQQWLIVIGVVHLSVNKRTLATKQLKHHRGTYNSEGSHFVLSYHRKQFYCWVIGSEVSQWRGLKTSYKMTSSVAVHCPTYLFHRFYSQTGNYCSSQVKYVTALMTVNTLHKTNLFQTSEDNTCSRTDEIDKEYYTSIDLQLKIKIELICNNIVQKKSDIHPTFCFKIVIFISINTEVMYLKGYIIFHS